MIPLTIWMNMPSFHQDGLFNFLTESGAIELQVVFARKTTEDRLRLGWTKSIRHYSYRFIVGKIKLLAAVRVAWSMRHRVHIVNGIWAEPAFSVALFVLALARSRFLIYAEAPDPGQSQSRPVAFLRQLWARWVAKRALGILSVSHFAERFYTDLGFKSERAYPFGYFQTHHVTPEQSSNLNTNERTEVIFVGELIPRKGVDLLLDAIRPLFNDYPNLFLSVIGDGNELERLKAAAISLGIKDKINFEGAMSSSMIQPRIALSDVLVLPSRWDGWGMVINEALAVGVPVIASDCCGAADLVQHGFNGYVFRSQDIEVLRECLCRFLDNPNEHLAMRSAASLVGRAVSAEAAAPYLIECLKHASGDSNLRPTPPWERISALSRVTH